MAGHNETGGKLNVKWGLWKKGTPKDLFWLKQVQAGWIQPYGCRTKARPRGSLDLRVALFHLLGGKIHELTKHPNSLVKNAEMFMEKAEHVKRLL
ncbi:MAG: hypothetical protein KUA35_07310 [Pseudodesulfovibrio sp.]|uniref:hypothetical protein n=1 Tax=Pseudodesulfovibrio TaxID=2035811 RepID=UPI0012FED194|nr:MULTISPECIES: hypothetical protein [Pseudodesulfovibrio]MBU4192726.1 hypothetical protein [Pseudomonadota bacterium]MBU4378687.1 hypothetical protein [Pseudomonadota bacterium]MBU4475055.1 hypothetical protein [Pseudomonadota bacterium]MBU4522079.1 hypothetical protein [Pseudomonadota bacterium]MBU4557778.1 hypothetical protein [Pseudomonadota bacterium]